MAAKTRDEIRKAIFSSEASRPRSKIIDFFGQQVEIRQPPVGVILDLRSADEDERKEQMIKMIIAYTYNPGTQEKLFDAADVETFLNMPFGPDFTRMSQAITELTNVNLATQAATKN